MLTDAKPFTFTYDGKKFSYSGENVGGPGSRKIYHEVTITGVDGGQPIKLDFSARTPITKEMIIAWYDKGMPTRRDMGLIGPIRMVDLEKYQK